MKVKRLLKFYFNAESLNCALDRLIAVNALNSMDCVRGGEFYAERICKIIGAKQLLGSLWNYLDGIVGGFCESEIKVLKFYGAASKFKDLPDGAKREIKRVTVKFTRRARALARYADGIKLVNEYYCLIRRDG